MAIVKKQEVIESWGILIGDAQGKAEEIFSNTDSFIEQTKVPNVKKERKKIAPGMIRGLFGTKRDFLVINETGNPRLKPFKMFIGARDYGNNLDVFWYLTVKPGFWTRFLAFLLVIPVVNIFVLPFALLSGLSSMVREKRGGLKLDLFDEQDLRAYVTNAHHCLLEALTKLMVDLHQDPLKIDRKSRGFLGIS